MVTRQSFFSFYLSILLRKNGLRRLRKLIWSGELRLVIDQRAAGINVIALHPLTCLSLGILNSQLVKVTFTLGSETEEPKTIERILKTQIDNTVSPGSIRISRCVAFNIFGSDLVQSVVVDNVTPKYKLHSNPVPVAENAKLSLIRQPNVPRNIRLQKAHLDQFLKSQHIFYKNDIIRLTDHNVYTDKTTYLYYKVDISTSPAILDASTAVYESSAVSHFLPFSNFLLTNPLTPSTRVTVNRMTQIYYAQRSISQKALVLLVTGASGSGKRLLSRVFTAHTHRNFYEVDGYEMVSENTAASEAKWTVWWEKANVLQNCVLFVRNAHVLAIDQFNALDRRILQHMESKLAEPSKVTVILSCTTDTMSSMAASVKNLALYTFCAEPLDESDRKTWLNYFLDEKLAVHVAKKTSGFTLAELEELVKNGKEQREKKGEVEMEKLFEEVIDYRNANFADAIGAPKIPNVRWEDVGGLEETKQTVFESIRTNLFGSRALKRSGIILYGAPGCGKTLIAKAVATEFKIAFLSVKGPELLNKYVGQSEENLRKVFERAKQASPCVIFFDEIDSLAPNRGRNGDSGGVIDRIVSQLLAEMDKLHNSPLTKVFVMGATNRPDLLDNSLMTPGRFDKMVEVKPGEDVESKTKILEAVSRKMAFDKDVNLREIAARVDEKMSGAQLFSIISNAGMAAIVETIQLIEDGEVENQTVRVGQRHLLESVQKFHATKV
uniref:Peroxisomal ATPase PEX1 n=1 Tax=Caenorhabditis japonica TaxID=281687 RepID=A0A8R1DUD3_CAEJA